MQYNHYKIFDMFCSNGSTYHDKEFFKSDNVFKNDLRKGDFKILNQTINIDPDARWDAFKNWTIYKGKLEFISADVVYLDPPHLKNSSTGLMVLKYTKLPVDYKKSLDIMFFNASKIAPVSILKWNSISFPVKEILKIAEKYFYLGFGNKQKDKIDGTVFITLINKKVERE